MRMESEMSLTPMAAVSKVFALTISVSLVLAIPAFADEYKRVIAPVDYRNMPWPPPRDKTLCREFGKALNFYAHMNRPLFCERPIPPQMQDFQRPPWQMLDPIEHLDLLRRLDRYLFWDGAGVLGPKREFSEDAWRTRVERNHRENRIKLGLAKIDLNADGHPETVLRYENRFPCEPERGKPKLFYPSPSEVNYFVVDDKLSVFQKVVILGFGAELFTYKGQVYFEWVTQDGGIRVTERMNPRVGKDSGCYMRFDPGNCPADQRPDFTFDEVCEYVFNRSIE